MRRIKRAYRWTRLAALILALALLLAGCAAPVNESGNEAGASEPTDISESENETEDGEADAAEGLPQGVTSEEPPPEEESDVVIGEDIEISDETARRIDRAVERMEMTYIAGSTGNDLLVEERDWSIYSGELSAANLSAKEAKFYSRLDNESLKYLKRSNLDGEEYEYEQNDTTVTYYCTGPVQYSDLGLTRNQAYRLLYWFVFNNPQYYFLNGAGLGTDTALYPCIYEDMSNGKERADITNELFDTLEGWVREVDARASTIYEKELIANEIICDANVYQRVYMGIDRVDQSLYSSVTLGCTVCTGYAKAFCAVMNALDVETTLAISDTHAWNVISFDNGNYYAVDVCWNDTGSSRTAYINVGSEFMHETNSRNESHVYSDHYAPWIQPIAEVSFVPEGQEAPEAPKNIRVTEDEKNRYVTWDEVSNTDGYLFARFKDATTRDRLKHSLDVDEPECSFPKKAPAGSALMLLELEAGATHYFGVRSYRLIGGKKVFSEWTEFTITVPADGSAQAVDQLAAPANFKAASDGENSVMLTWDSVPGATVYDTCAFTDATYTKIIEGCLATRPVENGEQARWTSLISGRTYYFGVRAGKDVNGETVYSDWATLSYTHEDAP